ncbi:inositol monophosphatase [Ferrimonas balearica DSM 9799]|uniref:Inositol-1-monophosphatase n=1 Tax=Ferrimonas balearica (strain DSM 9799 / CCM 4581 / KCTC 23876 / PAT) TaxID=550540 RepID=E1SRP4_FERBD|nr:inositol-1-monophosphatase [Ferrimonas balearica]ADN76965.1 inositol monophosphatase [Ferrimonas balearica DSM 9799]MBY5980069.1 inositol-1-monophosphatase [Ferrimonas balearica]
MHPMLNIAVRAARNAGNVIARAFEDLDKVEAEQKGLNDFVTNVDRDAERAIVATIQKAYPKHTIIGEECGTITGEHDEFQWIIDPLDGTTNFMKGIPHFAVSIALQIKGKIEHGVIYDPIRNELFSASRGAGVQLNGYRIRVANKRDLKGTILGTGFPFKQRQHMEPYMAIFAELFNDVADMRRAGSAALDLAYVAAGRLDGFWEIGLKPWDIAAGELMVREAGGLVSDFVGGHGQLTSGNIVAGAPKVTASIVSKMRAHLTESLKR